MSLIYNKDMIFQKPLICIFISLLFTLSFGVWGKKVDKKELNTFLEAVKEKDDEELLIGSTQFKDCETQLENFRKESSGKTQNIDNKKLLEKCVAEKIMGQKNAEGADKELLEIAKNLSLSSYNPEASKTSASIRKYLEKRIHKAIHGKDADKNNQSLTDTKLVNHDVYYQLYSEQIGKNTLLEVSRYCLENFGYIKADNFLYLDNEAFKEKSFIGFSKEYKNIPATNKKARDQLEFSKKLELNLTDNNVKQELGTLKLELKMFSHPKDKERTENEKQGFRFNKAVEYQVCTLPNKEQCDKKYLICNGVEREKCYTKFIESGNGVVKPYRNITQIGYLKDIEFLLSSLDPNKELIKARYNFCAGQVIHNMCKIYKCNNVYDANTPRETKKECEDNYGIKPENATAKNIEELTPEERIDLQSKDSKGFIACNILGRLEEYRMVLKGIKVIQDDNKTNGVRGGITADGAGFKGVYDGRGQVIDKLTSVGSKDLVSGVEEFNKSEENSKKLKEQCLDGNSLDGWTLKEGAAEDEKCKILHAKLDESKLGVIELDTEAKTALKMKEVDKIENKKDLAEFLKINGLDKFVGKLESLEVEQLKDLIKNDFKTKRMALIDNLNQRFEEERKLKTGENKDKEKEVKIKNSIANQTIADIEVHKRRVETLFEYSNIVSSYLKIEDKEGNEIGSNMTGRVIELESNEKLKENDYFSSDDQTGGSGDSLNYLSLISQILEPDSAKNKNKKKSP